MKLNKKPPMAVTFILGLCVMAASAAFVLAQDGVAASSGTTPAVTAPPAVPPTPAAAPAALETIGASTCLSCHQGQEHFKDTVHARAFAQVKGIEFEKSCETCHGPGSLHAAAAGDRANPGFATIKNLKKLPAIELNKTCFECHQDEPRNHWIGSKHEARNVSCLSCHSVHNAKEPKALLVQAKEEQVCASCHRDIVAKVKRNAHMPIEEGKMACSSCHNPHGSATPKNIKLASTNDTCWSCHADKRGPFLFEHPPVSENCITCHDPHGTHNEKMLNARQPFLCQRCHAATRHPSVAYDNQKIGQFDPKLLGESCTNCHSNVHGSNHPSGRYFTR